MTINRLNLYLLNHERGLVVVKSDQGDMRDRSLCVYPHREAVLAESKLLCL